MKRANLFAGLALLAALFAASAGAITILSVAGSNGSQPAGGVLTNATLANLYTDLATIGAALVNVPPGTTVIGGSLIDCATTAACPSTAQTTLKMVLIRGTLASGTPSTYAVTAMAPAFTSATSYSCSAQDTTTIANNVGVLAAGYVSGSAVTFTGPATNTDGFRAVCTGY